MPTAPASWMAASRPETMTPIRSATVITSSRSEETTRIAAPRVALAPQDRVNLRLGADVDADRRLVEDENARAPC